MIVNHQTDLLLQAYYFQNSSIKTWSGSKMLKILAQLCLYLVTVLAIQIFTIYTQKYASTYIPVIKSVNSLFCT